ncbi:MAG: GTPase [Planctomycetota bacterium]|nr:GTPase [Planctomycetota bacterium]
MLGNSAYCTDDTIVAAATPSGPAARAVVRLCGPHIRECLVRLWRPAEDPGASEEAWNAGQRRAEDVLASVSRPTHLSGWVKLDDHYRYLPCELYYWPDHRSFTRSPMAEIHCLGSDPVVAALLQEICQQGARLAEGGEFTLRAFLGGRIDLTQAEAVLGVIQATSDREFDRALKQLAGGLSQPLNKLRDTLLDLLADLEAGLDFADEDITFLTSDALQQRLGAAHEDATKLLAVMGKRQSLPASGRVVLVGKPNAGKSTLFNALTGGQALESDEPGTTRDYLSAILELEGLQCELVDTAGIDCFEPSTSAAAMDQKNPSPPEIESSAYGTTKRQWEQASLHVFCVDGTAPACSETSQMMDTVRKANGLIVITKCDQQSPAQRPEISSHVDIQCSAHTGVGIQELRRRLRAKFTEGSVTGSLAVASTAARCSENLQAVVSGLEQALEINDPGLHSELIAVEIRTAIDQLGQMVGAVYTEDMLDRIFSRFCIGK